MASSDIALVLGLGIVGLGGYFLFKDEIAGLLSGGRGPRYEEEIPPPIVYEDRFPDYTTVVEDRYPDIVYEDRYPDYYPYPYPYPVSYPSYYPYPYCPSGRYWNGSECKRIKIDCPPGYREDDGRCKPRHDCDRDEVWNGWTCVKIRDRDRDRDRDWNRDWNWPRPPSTNERNRDRNSKNNKKERQFNVKDWDKMDRQRKESSGATLSNRDKWQKDRDREEAAKAVVGIPEEKKQEEKRAEEVVEKAIQSFLELEYLY